MDMRNVSMLTRGMALGIAGVEKMRKSQRNSVIAHVEMKKK
jgi:hypothetical protein